MNNAANTFPVLQGQASTLGMGRGVPQYRDTIRRHQAVFPFGADHPWGIVDISGAKVTLAAGEFEVGNGAALATAQTVLTITADAQYIGLEYAPSGSGSLALIAPSTDKPVSGNGKFRVWLYFFRLVAVTPSRNAAQYVKHNLTGSWHAALYAATT